MKQFWKHPIGIRNTSGRKKGLSPTEAASRVKNNQKSEVIQMGRTVYDTNCAGLVALFASGLVSSFVCFIVFFSKIMNYQYFRRLSF